MKVIEDYTPDFIEFTVDSNQVPNSLGKFKTDKEARMFMSENLLAIQSKLRTTRRMDQVEIDGYRDEYVHELEDVLPKLREEHMKKHQELENAKQNEKDAKEMVSASLNKIQQLANEVNEGVTEIELDPANTYQVVYNGKKFYYTYIDEEIKLCAVYDVASYENDDLISSSEKNAEFFESLKTPNEQASS